MNKALVWVNISEDVCRGIPEEDENDKRNEKKVYKLKIASSSKYPKCRKMKGFLISWRDVILKHNITDNPSEWHPIR